MKPLISIVAPCYNEAENVDELYKQIYGAISPLNQYEFEIIFIDNSSIDETVELLKKIASLDKRVKIIVNIRNFGHIRSPYWAIMQSSGVATICMASDLQDPPTMIPKFIAEWELGWKVVMGVKPLSSTGSLMHFFRKLYYRFLDRISEVSLVKDATGFGIYDKVVLDAVRKIQDPYPYFRGLICELGYPIKTLEFNQPRRLRGISGNNFYSLYDIAMLGVISHSLVPIRVAGILGFVIGAASLITSLFYLVLKLVYWNKFPLGLAPLVIGIFMMFGALFIFIGLLGEYIGSIHMHLKNRPIVVEKERINF
jgi:dolichol-phosphate mannosyltransferase